MLHRYISQFLEYCQLADFSVRSIQALTARLNEFETCLCCSQGQCRKSQRIRSVKKVTYRHLVDFVADYKDPSIDVRKSRVWALRQFYHFLTLHRWELGDVIGLLFVFTPADSILTPRRFSVLSCRCVYSGFAWHIQPLSHKKINHKPIIQWTSPILLP